MDTFRVTTSSSGVWDDIEAHWMEIIDGCLVFSIIVMRKREQVVAYAPGFWCHAKRIGRGG